MTTAYEFHQLGFAYEHHALLNIKEGAIAAGKNTAILGPNGAGKSTLLNLLSFLEQPTAGSFQFFDESVDVGKQHQLRQQVGYVQQKPYLFNLSVKDNIELPLKLRGIDSEVRQQRAAQIMQQLHISHLSERRAHALSGGEIQKVALARALIIKPKVLILDEPFSHLDKQSAQFLETLILELKQDNDSSLIFSMHDQLKAHYLADQVFNLVDGHLLPSAMMNFFQGSIDTENSMFVTGKQNIIVPEDVYAANHLAIDARQLVLSRERLESSMRNQFRGRVVAMNEYHDQVRLSIDAGETFQAVITHAALHDLAINMGEEIWVSFKSSAVMLF